jgi:hypothetical protein
MPIDVKVEATPTIDSLRDVEHRQDRRRDPPAAPALKGFDCTPRGQQ